MSMGILALVLLAVLLGAALVIFAVGAHVVKRYPNTDAPERNARRYTRPVLGAAMVGIFAIIGLLTVLVVAVAKSLA